MCVVFAETEIIGLLAAGTAPADIVAGVQASIATRVAAMAGRVDDRERRGESRRDKGAGHVSNVRRNVRVLIGIE